MSRRSLVRGDVLHVKTAMCLGRFEVGKSCTATTSLSDLTALHLKKNRSFASGRWWQSTMVGNSRNSYDVPFRSCLVNSWYRAVNSILIAKLYLNVSRITEFTRNQDETILAIQTHFHWVTSLTGVVFPPSCRPSSFRLGRRRRRWAEKKLLRFG